MTFISDLSRRIFTPFRKTHLVTKAVKPVETGIDTDSPTEKEGFSGKKRAEASTHYQTYDRHGNIHEEGSEPEDPNL